MGQLRYYTEYQWLLDFSCYSLFTYILSELYISLLPAKAATEVNLSLVWVVLVLIFTYKLLLSLNGLYFEGEEAGGERSLVLVMGGFYLLFAMMVWLDRCSFHFPRTEGFQDALGCAQICWGSGQEYRGTSYRIHITIGSYHSMDKTSYQGPSHCQAVQGHDRAIDDS